ncbi:SPW repeat protein [Rhodococcus sp. 14C212]|uniref:SPW repeat domain-containing protein n=1 Tax=Rhodococcus sp. 14C212 TaxID=2711209 RepID=UPI0013ECA517|nr:SPW repeat protein [Rhodococcus sp. 14C212]NGP06631.1 SPW repeat protein [Rhodococcus sp. 14C212]
MKISNSSAGTIALILGIVTMTASVWFDTTPVGSGVTLGLGAIAAIYALWSLIARDPTKDHWSLSVVGLILFISPWIGQFAGDGAAWTAWIAGALIMLVGGAAYLADESADVAAATREEERRTYASTAH